MIAAEFIIGAETPDLFPVSRLPEVAFLGRSNVGKSSLLNRLVDRKGLARISSKPGCTQAVQFYRVGSDWNFVDLPGYGYAKVSREQSSQWKELIESYLRERTQLRLCLLLLDARRGWMESDLELKEWLEHWEKPYLAVATKVDKLKTQRERAQSKAALVEPELNHEPLAFSAITGQGVREIWQAITKTKNNNP